MKRSVEFDLVTKSEANRRGNSKIAQIIHAKHVAAQRDAVLSVLNSTFGAPPPLHVVQTQREPPVFGPLGEMGLTHRNKFAITLTRICIGKLDDDNLASALKAVRDEVAKWCDVPNDRDPIYTWKRGEQEAEQHVYRVKIEIVDLLTAPDKIVTLREGESAGRAAASKVKRAINKQIKASASAELSKADVDAYEGEMRACGMKRGKDYARVGNSLVPVKKPEGDPGEELSPQRLKPCSRLSCMAALDRPCVRDGKPDERFSCGVHIERARAAGVWTREDPPRIASRPSPRGPRKLVPHVVPEQPQLPMMRSHVALPWEQKTCDACGGAGILAPDGVEPWSCSTCKGTGRQGYVLAAFPRFDGVDTPPPSIEAPIPPEHAQRFAGPTITLTRRRFNSAATGVCWLYERTTER